jgi:hypothetical protein
LGHQPNEEKEMQDITKASEEYINHMHWVHGVTDGSFKPVWERFDNVQRVVSMAACIVDGHLIVGNRHFCPIMRMTLDNLNVDYSKHDVGTDQGFVDQWGVYMGREEAWVVAKAAGQIKEVFTEGVLFSECYL